MAGINITLLMGLWIVSIATVPIMYWYRLWKRKNCNHEYQNFRFCEKCGKREKQIEEKVE